MHRIDYIIYRTDCTLFTGLSVLYAQDWLHYLQDWVYFMHRTDCTLFTGLSVLYAQDWLYIIYRTECALYTRQCSLCTWASVELRMGITQGLPSLVHIGLVISEEKIVMWIQVTRWQMTDYVCFLIAKGHLEFSQVNWFFLWKHAVVCSPLLMCNTTNMIKTFGILVIWIPKKIKEIKNKIGAHQ